VAGIDGEHLKQIVEALIFASDEPITAAQIKKYVEHAAVQEIKQAVEQLNLEYSQQNRAFKVAVIAGGYQMVTREAYAQWVKKLFYRRIQQRLSQAALETLSVIAFKQPVSNSEISAIRGVNCDGVLRTLLERKLITISGRSDGPGRPLLYKTTKEFLVYFGINTLSDLPKPREIEEILKEKESLPEEATEEFTAALLRDGKQDNESPAE